MIYCNFEKIAQVIGGTQNFLSTFLWLLFGSYVTKLMQKKVERHLIDLEKREDETDVEHQARVYTDVK